MEMNYEVKNHGQGDTVNSVRKEKEGKGEKEWFSQCAPLRNAHSRLKNSYGKIVGNARIS
jgi:hypothetical protein